MNTNKPKLKYPQNISHKGSDIMQFMDYPRDFNMVNHTRWVLQGYVPTGLSVSKEYDQFYPCTVKQWILWRGRLVGLGRQIFILKITGSNPVRATLRGGVTNLNVVKSGIYIDVAIVYIRWV